MAMQFACGDVIHGCSQKFTAETEQEILKHVAAHAAAAHGLKEVTPEVVAKVKAAMKQVPAK